MFMLVASSLPKTDFWYKPERLARFWELVRWLIKFNMPWIMMGAAVILVGIIGGIIIDAMVTARRGDTAEDDEEPDIHYY